MRNRKELVAAFLTDPSTDDHFWAWQEMDRLKSQSRGEAIEITLELVEASETEEQLCMVAAGPLEDLLSADTFSRFALASRNSPKLRRALQAAHLSSTDDAYSQWRALLVEYHMWDRSDT